MNIAVIGCGVMGNYHIRNLNSFKDVNLSAICDTNLEKAKNLAKTYRTKYYVHHKELIKNEKLDAVTIAVPTKQHLTVALDFIRYSIPVFIEKPLAESSKSAEKIIQAAKKKKILLTVGHIERYNPAVVKLQELIDQKKLGKILAINIKRVGLFPQRITDVDVLMDLAVHDLDIITSLVKRKPKVLFARGSGVLTKGKYDHAEIFLDFGDFGGFIQVSWVTPIKIRQLSITGTKGHAELNYTTQELFLHESIYKITQVKGYQDFIAKFGQSKTKQVKVKNEEPLKLELRNFIDSLKNRTKPRVTTQEALNAVKLAELTTKSIKEKRAVKYL